MDERRAHKYLIWLEKQVTPDRAKSYSDLLGIMHAKEFVWLIPNDDNRIADGLDVRAEFLRRSEMLIQGCSVLEVVIGLSRRIAFIAGGDPGQWAWDLVCNLDLRRMSGHIGAIRAEYINDILERLIWRTYQPDGGGGLFPLAWPVMDQRKVELWYQMCAYIEELPEL